LDEAVISFRIAFLCCDANIVRNIISDTYSDTDESMTPIIIANRCIHGINVRTYHRFESQNINYHKCRKHLIMIAKMIMMLVKHINLDFPSGYVVTPEQHENIFYGKMHLAELFNNHWFLNGFHIDDLEDIEYLDSKNDQSRVDTTDCPQLHHALDASILYKLKFIEKNKDHGKIRITNELAKEYNMTPNTMVKYLALYEICLKSKEKKLVEFDKEIGNFINVSSLYWANKQVTKFSRLQSPRG
tara:strand:+ start:637 stop:1368 length:732 start_codon:yes stop_codon:yes gene_type:complete